MKAIPSHTSNARYYWSLLERLDKETKLDLIILLAASLKKEKSINEVTLQSLFGAYKSDESAEEIISGLYNARNFNRNIESL